jgi:F420 biosynthesis protein FbiB-like protein
MKNELRTKFYQSKWTPTELHEFLRSRRSIRHFEPTAVNEDVLNRMLETATFAPSAHNRQPWRFAVLTHAQPKIRLSKFLSIDYRRDLAEDQLSDAEIEIRLNRSINRIINAPVVIVLSMDTSEMDIYPDEKRANAERIMAVQSTAAAGLQLQLAAHAEGLSSVWTCAPLFSPHTVKAALDLPDLWEPQAMFFIGYPDKKNSPK